LGSERVREGEEEAAAKKTSFRYMARKSSREKARDAVMLDVEKSGKRGLLKQNESKRERERERERCWRGSEARS
jgi:hypothetical protein